MNTVSLVIPTYNEVVNIGVLIKGISSFLPDANIIVVDDNSPDLTWQYVESIREKNPKVHLIKNKKKSGISNAYKKGFNKALEIGSDIIGQMDADLSHNPQYLVDMIKLTDKYDLVIGSRYKTGVNVINWPMKRVLLSYFANKYASLVTGVSLKDFTSGFKIFRSKVIKKINFSKVISDGYSFQIEISYLAHELGFKIFEFPIVFTDRVNGVSKLDRTIVLEALLNVMKLRLKKSPPKK